MKISTKQKFFAATWPMQVLLAGCFIGIFLLVVFLTFASLLPVLRTFPFWQSSLLLAFCVPLAILLGLLLGVLGMFYVFVIIVMPMQYVGGRLNGAPFREGDVVRILSGVHQGKTAVVRERKEKGFLRVDVGEKVQKEGEDIFLPCQLLREKGAEPISGRGMSATGMRLRIRNALSSGAAAFLALLSMALWIGGPADFWSLVSPLLLMFSAIALFGAAIGACLRSARLRWSLLAGAVSGLAGGAAIALHAMSHI